MLQTWKIKNPTIYNIIRWFAGSLGQMTRQPSVWCSKYYLFFLIISCKNGFNLLFYKFTKIKMKSFECPKSIRHYKKIMPGTSDRTSEPANFKAGRAFWCAVVLMCRWHIVCFFEHWIAVLGLDFPPGYFLLSCNKFLFQISIHWKVHETLLIGVNWLIMHKMNHIFIFIDCILRSLK